MRFLVDAQLPPALVDLLKLMGHEADHVFDLGLVSASDQAVWDFAVEHGAIIFTKDEDFRAMRLKLEVGPAVIWLRIGNTTTPALLNTLSGAWSAIISALERGEPIIEVT